MVTVATFNERDKAEPLRQRFEKAGIHAEVQDEHRFEWLWFVFKPLAAIRLKVHKQDFERAHKLLNEWDAAEGVLRDSVRCPKCKSSRVEYPQFTRKGVLPNLVGLASAFGFIGSLRDIASRRRLHLPRRREARVPTRSSPTRLFRASLRGARRSRG